MPTVPSTWRRPDKDHRGNSAGLAVPSGRSTRPTSDRTREGLFAAVVATLGGLDGAHVLDLYAGSGAVGLEALSRGAADAALVESDPAAVQVIRQNVEAVGLKGATVIKDRVGRVLRRGPGAAPPRDFVFADPPYTADDDELRQVLVSLASAGWLAAGALVVVERDARRAPALACWIRGGTVQAVRRDGALVRSRRGRRTRRRRLTTGA